MLLFIKHAVITVAGLIAFLAAIIVPVAWISHGMSDNHGDDTGRLLSFSALCVFAICTLLIIMLTGCSTGKAILDACRDGLCR